MDNQEQDFNVTGQQNIYEQEQQEKSDKMAVTVLVLGILSIICCAPTGIAGLIIGLNNRKFMSPDKQSLCKAGIITSIIGLSLWALGILFYVVVVMMFGFSTLGTSSF